MSNEKLKTRRPVPPHLPARLDPIRLDLTSDTCQYRDVFIEGVDLKELSANRLCFRCATIRSSDLQKTSLPKLELMDVSLQHINASNGAWQSCSMFRTEIAGCRLTGIDLSASSFQEVLISDTSLELANFRFSRFKNVCFENCLLREADFQGADLQGVRFRNCDMRRAQLSSARLEGTDFRGSELEGLIVAPEHLRGAIIDTAQLMTLALSLTQAFGIVVRDEE
jgi:uncharacterized protein YjbI with pentapeptide repeats